MHFITNVIQWEHFSKKGEKKEAPAPSQESAGASFINA